MPLDDFALEPTSGLARFRWAPSPHLLTPAGTLQGGAGLGAAATAMELVTDRPLVWATAQYLSFAPGTAPIDIDVNVEVSGHLTSQARCVLSRDGREILTALAALGRRDVALDDVWCPRPDVPAPDRCAPFSFIGGGNGDLGDRIEFRLARGRQLAEILAAPRRGDGSFAVWARCWPGERAITVADLAFIGDFMPVGFADAMGASHAGNSLDNTIRVGRLSTTSWVLLDVRVQQVANGFGYGRAELWTEDGTLLGEVSQSWLLRSRPLEPDGRPR